MATKKIITEDSPAEQGQRAAKLDDAIRAAIKRGDEKLARELINTGIENGRNIKFSDFVKESTDPLIGAAAAALSKKPEGLLVTEMAFTRQHYTAVAEVIRVAKHNYADNGAIHFIATELADMFKRDNVNFHRAKFLSACGF